MSLSPPKNMAWLPLTISWLSVVSIVGMDVRAPASLPGGGLKNGRGGHREQHENANKKYFKIRQLKMNKRGPLSEQNEQRMTKKNFKSRCYKFKFEQKSAKNARAHARGVWDMEMGRELSFLNKTRQINILLGIPKGLWKEIITYAGDIERGRR